MIGGLTKKTYTKTYTVSFSPFLCLTFIVIIIDTMEKRILSFEEACTYTGFAESYMYKLTSARKIPHSKPNGKKIFFDREQLDKWLLSNPIVTAAEIEAKASTYISTHKKNKQQIKK